MKIEFVGPYALNVFNLVRACGYTPHRDSRNGEMSFLRRLGREIYPHFHLYVQEQGDHFVLNLHLDAKRPSYQGFHAHSGEYDSEVVQSEGERIKRIIASKR